MPVEQTGEWVALNADVVGYSALVADDVEATSAAMSHYHQLVSSIVEANDGVLANFVGDSFMAVFRNAMAGLKAAIAITQAVEAENADVPSVRQVRFRMGMDQGEVTFADGNHHGDALNIAARIQALAVPGGLSVSSRVYRALDEPALRFRARGRQDLKNIPERVGVYDFVDLPTGADKAGMQRSSLALETPSLAVLPIHTEGVDDRVLSGANLIRADLLHGLSQIPGLDIIDASAEPGDGKTAKPRYMVETGVHQFGERVRVYAMLFDMSTMNVVKSHKWSRTVDEMFDLSETVAEDLTHSVEVDLVVGEPARLYAELDDPQAIEQIYLGWYHLRAGTRDGWRKALGLFQAVGRSHPDHPYGYVLAAFAQWLGAANQWTDVDEALAEAMALAKRGRKVGDPTGMAQAVEAAVLQSWGRADEALAVVDQLEVVRPTCDITYGLEGSIRRYLGQWERAVELLDQAMSLTGINKPWYPTVKASSLYVGGRLEDAAALAEGVLEYQPMNLEALLVLAAAQVELGLERRSKATAALIKERFPTVDTRDWLDQHPYERREFVARWKESLASAEVIATPT